MIHILNAPSPAATASFAIADHIIELFTPVQEKLKQTGKAAAIDGSLWLLNTKVVPAIFVP